MSAADRTLVIETATEACSIALFDGDKLVAKDHREIGRGHAETLVPMIADLPDKGRADHILVSLGPGSFTGVRIGIATARALSVAWGSKVLGYPTLALVAQVALSNASFAKDGAPMTVCMNGGHGEFFIQSFRSDGFPQNKPTSLTPQKAARVAHPRIAGNRAEALADLVASADARALHCVPNASYAPQISDELLTSDVTPIYGRAPDAKPQIVA